MGNQQPVNGQAGGHPGGLPPAVGGQGQGGGGNQNANDPHNQAGRQTYAGGYIPSQGQNQGQGNLGQGQIQGQGYPGAFNVGGSGGAGGGGGGEEDFNRTPSDASWTIVNVGQLHSSPQHGTVLSLLPCFSWRRTPHVCLLYARLISTLI